MCTAFMIQEDLGRVIPRHDGVDFGLTQVTAERRGTAVVVGSYLGQGTARKGEAIIGHRQFEAACPTSFNAISLSRLDVREPT